MNGKESGKWKRKENMEVVVDEWKAEAQNGKAQDGTYGPP